MENIVAQLDSFRVKIVHIMANVSGRAEPDAEILLLAILWYVVFIIIIMYIHSKLLKRQKKIHKNLVLLYDTMWYQVARAQYGNPAIQESKWIKVVIDADHKNYITNAKTIREEILSIEQKLGQQIVTTEQWNIINKQTKKKNNVTVFVQLIGRLTTVLTVGIYKVFW
jgi:hypothetical protein